jgi:hypothetical protein
VVGGLAVSQVLTLYFTPVIYLYMEQLKSLLSRRRRATPPEAAPESITVRTDAAAE